MVCYLKHSRSYVASIATAHLHGTNLATLITDVQDIDRSVSAIKHSEIAERKNENEPTVKENGEKLVPVVTLRIDL